MRGWGRAARVWGGISMVFAVSVIGCERGPQRYALRGSVIVGGQRLAEGAITFRPVEGTRGPSAGGDIKAGLFSIPASGGPLAGRFRVEITASRPSDAFVPGMDGEMVPAYEQWLPARYNTASELRADVGESGENRFDFVLDSDG